MNESKRLIKVREAPRRPQEVLMNSGLSPVLARVLSARGIKNENELDDGLAKLAPLETLKNCKRAGELLADTIANEENILIVADYDADGATAAAITIIFLRDIGIKAKYFVPNRFEHGYGLTPEIVDIVAREKTNLIITVDNGIASIAGVARAKELGIKVLITDHHLPGSELPQAECIVNPNQPNDAFVSKCIAGVGVMFYVLIALRAELRNRGYFKTSNAEPNLAELLDLVALGTIADVVPIDQNNRILVAQGLRRIRSGKMNPGIEALLRIAKKKPSAARSTDFGFAVGPRLNAAGRLTDMKLGIECLISEDIVKASNLAKELDRLNVERRQIEGEMKDQALKYLENIETNLESGITLFDPQWHSGIVGILASRVKEKFNRPTIAFAPEKNKFLKGSGRSIQGIHLRDVLDILTKMDPTVIDKFGGHAMAAGLTIHATNLAKFTDLFNKIVTAEFKKNTIDNAIYVDGSLGEEESLPALAHEIRTRVWGQGFPEPVFRDELHVRSHRIIAETHTKLRVSFSPNGEAIDAIRFNFNHAVPDVINTVYRLDINDFYDHKPAQLIIETW
ncbi:MAG: single-stranded-DNA-specific exonuclease RecJ [Burkholderiales bacterium]|nr:MAG: single-stranded-DNA-specific exonuclease RecJ [Betaproteobacteria bacterium TMED22]|tara:strand:+ start:1193 stop:2896 length:1704 start_codon:yes stop_codon:yes gene_type:complete